MTNPYREMPEELPVKVILDSSEIVEAIHAWVRAHHPSIADKSLTTSWAIDVLSKDTAHNLTITLTEKK